MKQKMEKKEKRLSTMQHVYEYCKSEVAKQIAASNALDVDGIVVNYTGFDLNSLVEENEIAAETARQGAFFDAVANWKVANTNKDLLFKGSPQNVIGKNLLSDCKYIIVNAAWSKKPIRDVLSHTHGISKKRTNRPLHHGSNNALSYLFGELQW